MNRWTIGLAVVAVILAVALYVNIVGGTPKKVDGPLTKEAKQVVAERDDALEADQVYDAGIARSVPCGRILKAAVNPYSGKARYFYARDDAGTVECFDGEGYSREIPGYKLRAIDGAILTEIRDNPDLYPVRSAKPAEPAPTPTPASTPAPIVVVVPTPSPCTHAPGVRILSEKVDCTKH